jgi:hypothetical protein
MYERTNERVSDSIIQDISECNNYILNTTAISIVIIVAVVIADIVDINDIAFFTVKPVATRAL